MKIIKKDRHQMYREIGEYLKDKKDNEFFNTEIKKWKPLRTLSQNAFFHLLCSYISKEMGYSNEPEPVKTGIKEKYGYKMKVFDELVPKPSHLCDKFEEMNVLIEGCFIEAGEQGIDVRDFIRRWEDIKRQREYEKIDLLLEVTP